LNVTKAEIICCSKAKAKSVIKERKGRHVKFQ